MKESLLRHFTNSAFFRFAFCIGVLAGSPFVLPPANSVYAQTNRSLGDSECFDDNDCDDGDPCTDDYCSGGLCFHEPFDFDADGVCDLNDNCEFVYNPDQYDYDWDGIGDECDDDIDGDGVNNDDDLDDYNIFVCQDSDGDDCDDCSAGYGYADIYSDGYDYDNDGLCDNGDDDDDNDGVSDFDDPNDNDIYVCGDSDGDGCDDCSQGYGYADIYNDGYDYDYDGLCDLGDPDDDNDGVPDEDDWNDANPAECQDLDNDGCDDCSWTGYSGYPDPNYDGDDSDGDGICDFGDDCDNAAPGIPNFNYSTCHCELGYYEVYEGDVLQGQNGELRVPIEVVVACNPCLPGTYCPDGISGYPCPAGTFMDEMGAISCNACPDGYYSVEGETTCHPLSTCEDGIMNGTEEGIDCGGPDCAACPPPQALCGVITVYVGGPDYDGPGSQNVWLIPAEDLDAGSSSSSMSPDIDVLRYLSTITFNWTTMGACEDMIPNGTYNNPDKGTVYRDCYPAVPGNFNVWKLYKLRIQDEFGSDDCAGTVKVIQEPALVAPVIHLVIPDTDEYISTEWNAGLGLHENPESVVADLIVVPNPGRDAMQVNWSSLSEGNADITVVDMAGRRVISQNILMLAGENKVVFDMSSVTPGVYAILLRTENTVMSVKWIKD